MIHSWQPWFFYWCTATTLNFLFANKKKIMLILSSTLLHIPCQIIQNNLWWCLTCLVVYVALVHYLSYTLGPPYVLAKNVSLILLSIKSSIHASISMWSLPMLAISLFVSLKQSLHSASPSWCMSAILSPSLITLTKKLYTVHSVHTYDLWYSVKPSTFYTMPTIHWGWHLTPFMHAAGLSLTSLTSQRLSMSATHYLTASEHHCTQSPWSHPMSATLPPWPATVDTL